MILRVHHGDQRVFVVLYFLFRFGFDVFAVFGYVVHEAEREFFKFREPRGAEGLILVAYRRFKVDT